MSKERPLRESQVAAVANARYIEAFRSVATRLQESLKHADPASLPVKMVIAGGAAVHFYTGARISSDIDASFSKRFALPDEGLEVAYTDDTGGVRLLYLDRQYNDSLGLLHEDAHADARPLRLDGIDPGVLDLRLLQPIDLAVSKLSRYGDTDQDDILALAHTGAFSCEEFRARAEEALHGYVGSVDRVRLSLNLACKAIDDSEGRSGTTRPKPPSSKPR